MIAKFEEMQQALDRGIFFPPVPPEPPEDSGDSGDDSDPEDIHFWSEKDVMQAQKLSHYPQVDTERCLTPPSKRKPYRKHGCTMRPKRWQWSYDLDLYFCYDDEGQLMWFWDVDRNVAWYTPCSP